MRTWWPDVSGTLLKHRRHARCGVVDVPGRQRQTRGVLHRQGEPLPHGAGFFADRCGATSVASAFGIRLGATPRGLTHVTIHSQTHHSKPDISTWQTTGHFYLALTQHV
jgi:hypothetical protein